MRLYAPIHLDLKQRVRPPIMSNASKSNYIQLLKYSSCTPSFSQASACLSVNCSTWKIWRLKVKRHRDGRSSLLVSRWMWLGELLVRRMRWLFFDISKKEGNMNSSIFPTGLALRSFKCSVILIPWIRCLMCLDLGSIAMELHSTVKLKTPEYYKDPRKYQTCVLGKLLNHQLKSASYPFWCPPNHLKVIICLICLFN